MSFPPWVLNMGNVEDTSYTFKDVVLILKGGWHILLLIGLFSFLLSAYIVKTTEPKYEAHTVLELAKKVLLATLTTRIVPWHFFCQQHKIRTEILI